MLPAIPITRRAARTNAAGVDHFCFEADAASIDEAVESLKRAGIEIADGPLQRRDSVASCSSIRTE